MIKNTMTLRELRETIKRLVAESMLAKEFSDNSEDVAEESSKEAAKSFVKGHKTFADKVASLRDKEGVENPEGLAAWLEKQATGHWPSEK
jgi:hypothetical protein